MQEGVLARVEATGMNAVAPVWQSVALIRDEVTSTLRKAGQISVTAVMLADFILALVRRRLPQDWTERYNTTPVLIETFV